MALDKLVNSEKLDNTLRSEADAIRSRTRTTDAISFDYTNETGFSSAIMEIPMGEYNVETVEDEDEGFGLDITSSGAGITDGIVVKARDTNGYATEVDYYNSSGVINRQEFCSSRSNGFLGKVVAVNFKNVMTSVRGEAFRGSALSQLSLPDVTDVYDGDSFREMSQVTTILLPKVTSFHNSQYIFADDNKLIFVQLGSVGNTLPDIRSNAFNGVRSTTTIEVYTVGTYADTLLSSIRNGAVNATIIIKASEDTTYNGTAYAAGETILTSEVA